MMNIEVRSVVIVKAGKEKNSRFVVTEVIDDRFVLIADGRKRKISHPKKKNILHLQATGMKIDSVTTDRKLRVFLRESQTEV
ncbi:MAG: KOW domain-containing RNA-binding protein [Ruminococcus sp.]|nr:KOW domain-containing RNA-binding protein [Ruminococcus sp.]